MVSRVSRKPSWLRQFKPSRFAVGSAGLNSYSLPRFCRSAGVKDDSWAARPRAARRLATLGFEPKSLWGSLRRKEAKPSVQSLPAKVARTQKWWRGSFLESSRARAAGAGVSAHTFIGTFLPGDPDFSLAFWHRLGHFPGSAAAGVWAAAASC